MPLVEHDPRRAGALLGEAARRLDHDQGVVRDDQLGVPRAADSPFDEAPRVMAAGGIDAFPPSVGEPRPPARSQQVAADRQSVVWGKGVYVRVSLGGRRSLKKKKR